jgi:sugar lactone lactonase YvrE
MLNSHDVNLNLSYLAITRAGTIQCGNIMKKNTANARHFLRNKYALPLLLLPGILLPAFASAAASQTRDYVGDNVFTKGIEGPAVDKDGNLYAVNIGEEGTIGIVSGKNEAKLFVKLPAGSTGNGIRFGPNGAMYVADYTGHNVLRIDTKTRETTVYAHDHKLNQPNDIAISKAGLIYASDPNWKDQTGRIWKIDLQGNAKILEDKMGTTNGIEVSADEKYLYVNESVQRKVWKYDIDSITGDVSNKRLLIEFPYFGMDGMRCDTKGNLYIARYGAGEVAVVSPEGKLLKVIKLKGRDPTNIAFGGEDGKTVFVTLQDRGAIEYFKATESGREWVLTQAVATIR